MTFSGSGSGSGTESALCLAARLSGKMRAPPPNMNEGEWVLRRSRIQIFAGQADDGLIAVVDWLSGIDQLSEEMLDRVMQVFFDLQTIGRHPSPEGVWTGG
ncbi:MAG: hypothetical protein Ct9H300mP14_15150 [Gammaproteobacteria bacterium]|nr:MAG: hypothetical protein Ct9H300mP14_15150 [Gammaproteobacteria bacterium]